MQVFGYGEDSLTFWALTRRLPAVLKQLGDSSSAKDALLFYRPSFGRGGGSFFGEFDAILATPAGIYLIETKATTSTGLRNPVLRLDEAQARRHEIFRWYLNVWRQVRPNSWDAFREAALDPFEHKFEGRTLPRATTKLAQNLEFVLERLAGFDTEVRDVLLFVGPKGSDEPSQVIPDYFELVCMEYEPANAGGYLDLTRGRS